MSVNISSNANNIVVTYPTTRVVRVIAPGPRGIQGEQGIPGELIGSERFATTGSNTFTDNQIIQGSISASYYEGDGSRLTNLQSTTNWKIFTPTTVKNTEQLTFSGDYILEDAYLLIEGGDYQVEYSQNKSFKKQGTIFIGGNLLVKDSTIVNNGIIGVGGEVVLIGNSQIIGTGTII